MKRYNGKLLNKALAIAVTASLVLSLTPAAAIAGFSGEGQRDVPSSTDSSAADDETRPEPSGAAASGSGDASSSSENAQPGASPSDAQAEGSQEAPSGASPGDASASSRGSGAAPEERPLSDLTKLDLVEVDPVSREDLADMLSSDPAYAPRSLLSEKDAAAAAFPSELDGSKIEQISVHWITPDTTEDGDESRLSLVPGNDDKFPVRMRLNMALSGEHDYEAGDIQVTVPKSIFKTRDGKATGPLSLSVPEAPDSRALFNYTDMGDYYLLANTRKLSAATSAMFEFTAKDLVPHTIVDGVGADNEPGYDKAYTSAPFEGTVQVTTHLGNTISMSSNKIDCTIDTTEKVTGAHKEATMLSEEWPGSWPAELKPENDQDYIYVDWYTYAWISGNQAFDMKVEENASTDQSQGTVLLGYRDSSSGTLYAVGGSDSTEQTLQTGAYVSPGTAFGGHAYVAYPKANFQVNNTYKLDNKVKYTLTSADDGTVTEASATAEATYSPVAFQVPGGFYAIEKRGDGSSTKYVDGDVEGIYGYALNQLRNGEDVDLSYRISSHAFTMHATKDPAGDEDDPGSYNKKTVNLKLVDDETRFNFADECLSAADFRFKSVQVDKPSMLVYKKFSQSGFGYTGNSSSSTNIQAGSYGYVNDNDPANIPVLYVYGKTETGDWARYASLDWTGGGLNAVAENGASVSSSTVNFPEGIVDYKIELSTNRDGIVLSAKPTMTLKATDAVRAQVEELYADSAQPTTKASNKVTLTASGEDGAEYGQMSSVGRDRLDGASLAVRQTKEASYESDPGERCVNIHYRTTVYEQSNLTDMASYDQAIGAGAIKAEKEGTFYDLLPMGVEPIADSVKVRDGDTVTGVRTIENYKDSGRTLLVVKAKLSPSPRYRIIPAAGDLSGYCDEIAMSFDAKYAWTSLTDYGKEIDNVISFESGNDQLGTVKGFSGEPDKPTGENYGYSKDATSGVEELMTDLDPDRDTNSFTYANCATDLVVDTSAVTGLLKRVSVNGDGYYDDGKNNDHPRNVYEGGRYTYSLRMKNTEATSARDIVIYDNLENYVPIDVKDDYQDTQWRGTFAGVDVSQLRQKGIEPVVYYSTKADLVLDDTNNRAEMDLSDSGTWTTACPDDKSTITAIAIDASKDAQGKDFVLGKGESIVSYIHMVAPKVRDLANAGEENQWYDSKLENGQAEAGLAGGAHAYNNVSMLATIISALDGKSTHQLIRNDYTKVGLLPFGLETTKTWSDNDDQDGKRPDSVTVHLYANGIATGKKAVLSADNNWSYNWTAAFDDIRPADGDGTPINYTFVEDEVPGYTLSTGKSVDNGVFKFALTNRHTPEKVSIPVSKTWDDDGNAANARPDSITLKLYRGGDLLRTQQVKPDSSGNWSYSFDGLDKYENGAEIDYSVREDYVPGYVAAYGDNGEIANKYDPYGDLTIAKTIEGATPAAADREFTFKLSLAKESGEVDTGDYAYTTSDGRSGTIAAGGTLTLKGGQTATIKNLPSEDSYTISEVEADGYTVTDASNTSGTIHAGQTANVSITNAYESTGSVQLRANKALTGRALANKQFSFQVLDEDGKALRSASCKADGSVAFGLIKYDASDDGKTYTYYIQEKVPADAVNAEGVTWEAATDEQKAAGGFSKKGYAYDSSKHKATVAVADNGDGTMKATATYEDGDAPRIKNAYKATGSVTLNLWKTLAARDLKDGEFTFGLFDEQGDAVLDKDGKAITAKNAADGTVTFPSIPYDQDDAGQTYTYAAKEIVPDEGDAGYDETVVYDKTEWKYRVSVYDNGDGTLSFDQKTISADGEEGKLPVIANALKPGGLTISKGVKGGNPGQEFKFLVKLTSPTGESLDGDYDFKREEYIPQTVDITSVDAQGAALPGVGYTVYKVAPDGSRTVIGDYVSDDDGSVNIQGLDKFEEGWSYIASITDVPDGYKAPGGQDVALEYDSAKGTWSSTVAFKSQAYAYYDEATHTLTFARAKGAPIPTGKQGSIDYFDWTGLDVDTMKLSLTRLPWHKYRGDIQKVVIKDRIAPIWMVAWFYDCENLESIQGMDLLDDSNLEEIGGTFYNCKKLTELDLSSISGGTQLSNMSGTFDGCSNLKTIYVSDAFSANGVGNDSYCFDDCTSLVGGAGTTFSADRTSTEYAHIDGGPSNPGYFTDIADKPAGASAPSGSDSELNTAGADKEAPRYAEPESEAESGGVDADGEPADAGLSGDAAALAAANSGTWGTCVWEFGDDGVFTIKPADGVEGTLYSADHNGSLHYINFPWRKLDKSGIKKIEIEGTVHAGQSVRGMFIDFNMVESIDLGNFDTSATTDMSVMFYNCGKLASLDLSGLNTSNVTDMERMFYDCKKLTSLNLSGFDTSKVTDMSQMFRECSSLASLDVSRFDTSNVTNMSTMFYDCDDLTSLDVSGFKTSNVTNMSWMFANCGKLASLDLSRFNTSKVTDMDHMFTGGYSLTSINLGGFDTSHVVDMSNMFYNNHSLKSLDVSSFDTSRVTNMSSMFYGCSGLESLDLSSFKTPKLTDASEAFSGCSGLKSLDVRNFDASNAYIGRMLEDCRSLTKIVLGEKPFFKGKGDSMTHLPDPSANYQWGKPYTGKWVCVDDPSIVLDAETLSNSHPSADAPAGTWVAQEKPTAYTVAFDPNGGAGSMAKQSYKVDADYRLPANSFYLFAKRFAGWNTAADGSGTSYADGATVRNLANAGDNVTLYAQWADDSSGTLTDGEMEVTLHGNESLTIPNLPAGTRYQVYEQTPSGWVLVKQSGESGVIEPLKNAQATFVNDYQPGKAQATIVGAKTVDGDAGKVNAGDYSFELRDSGGMLLETVPCGAGGSIAFSPITYEAAGTWTYKVKEVVPQDQGSILYDAHEETVTVTVSDAGAGNLSSSVRYDGDGVAFDNHDATPTTGRLRITKTVEGSADASKEFTFDVVTIKDGVRNTRQVTVHAGQTLDLGEFPEGTTYSIAEADIPAGYALKGSSGAAGTIVAGETRNATFTNAYSAKGSVALRAIKKLAGGTLEAGRFSFELRDKATGDVLQTVANDADGSVAFEPISYDAAGTYRYTIAEVVPGQGGAGYDDSIAYDSHVEDVRVDVADRGDGTLAVVAAYDRDGAVFENSVKPGSIRLTKRVAGGTEAVAGKKFPFELVLKDAKGEPLPGSFAYSDTDGATGTVGNGGIVEVAAGQTVTIEGIPAGAAYEFVERVPAGFSQQSADAVQGVVGAGKTASASVVNAYAASGSWTPDATKVLTGSELASGQFTFKLLDGEGNVLQTASNDGDGKIAFQPIQYTAEDHGKAFEYSIVEVNDKQGNYVYDPHAAKVNVAVKDNGDGTMTVTPAYGTGDDGNIFTNLWKLVMPETGRVSYPLLAGLGLLVALISSAGLALRRNRRNGGPRDK